MSQPKGAHRLATQPKYKEQVSDQKRTQTKSEPPRLAFCVSRKSRHRKRACHRKFLAHFRRLRRRAELDVTLSHARAPKIAPILTFQCISAAKAAPRQKSALTRPCATCLCTSHSPQHARSLMLALACSHSLSGA